MKSADAPSPPLTPEVLFEDNHLIVINKPAGLLSQGEHTGSANVVDWLRKRLGRPYVGLIHRLDRNTSGVMVVAKRTKAAQRLTEALTRGEIYRSYLAWLVGELTEPKRLIHHLLKDESKNQTRVVAPTIPGAKRAELLLEPIKIIRPKGSDQKLTLARFVLETGRSHQIRVQAAHEGFCLLGDTKYGKAFTPQLILRPALHSEILRLKHPMSHEEMQWTAPLPHDFEAIAAAQD